MEQGAGHELLTEKRLALRVQASDHLQIFQSPVSLSTIPLLRDLTSWWTQFSILNAASREIVKPPLDFPLDSLLFLLFRLS
jgi:hypothetical protein